MAKQGKHGMLKLDDDEVPTGYTQKGTNIDRANELAEKMFEMLRNENADPPDGISALLMGLTCAMRLLILDPDVEVSRRLNRENCLTALRRLVADIEGIDVTSATERERMQRARREAVQQELMTKVAEKGAGKKGVFH